MRVFETGATRDDDEGKIDFEGILSPAVLEAYGRYMLKHSVQADGQKRASDNWQKGIPLDTYIKSAIRHVFEWWTMHRAEVNYPPKDVEETLCAVMFNVMGYLHESLKLPVAEFGGGYKQKEIVRSDELPETGYIHTIKCPE